MRLLALSLFAVPALLAATAEPNANQIGEIIKNFAAKEADFAKARESYTYRQTVKVEELDDSGNALGKWEVVADIIFGQDGKRTEHVIHAPVPTLERIILTPEDMQDLRDVQPFVLTTSEIVNYDIRYLGRQTLDEISCYEFTVKPKQLIKGKRYFEGEIWVDDKDLQIVKTYGKGVGQQRKSADNQYPKFETYREQIDGKYWFPTYTYANDTLQFREGPQRIKEIIKYQDYKQFKSDVVIKFEDSPAPEKPPAEPQQKPPNP
jgi:hypothetical protein